jgi:hypothetical protein
MRLEEIDRVDGIPIDYICFRIFLEERYWNWNWWHWSENNTMDYSVFVTFSMDILSSEIVDPSYYPYPLYNNKIFKQQRIEHVRLEDVWNNYILFPPKADNCTMYPETISISTFQQKILDEFIHHLGTLKLDLLEGVLYSTEHTLNFKELYSLSNVELAFKIEQCVVCYEKTRTFTNCKHFLCVTCASRLQTLPKRCPVCRHAPLSIQK